VGYDWLAGDSNDLVTMWVNPISAVRQDNTSYATNTNLGSDMIGVVGARYLPFGSVASPSPGVLTENLIVTYSADSTTAFTEAFAAVPEPSTLLLLCGSLAVAALLGGRRFLRA
jgi:hypothetical protein